MSPNGNSESSARTPAELGQVVRKLRRERGLTQDDVAFSAGVGRRFLIDLEAGKPTVQLGLVIRVLQVLGADLAIDTR